jgi:dTDP-4-amino-4,6-dideoxygalactose transaminase
MAQGVHKITEDFEIELSKYTGAKYVVTVDNQSNALFLALYYEKNIKKTIGDNVSIPCRTYPSVPCEIIHVGLKVKFIPVDGEKIKGAYQLVGSNIYDSALRFTCNMYIPQTHMCVSFTGPYKHLKLGKGGAILTDDENAYKWFKKARFSGRDECSYHTDNFDINPVVGWNFYMMPEISARGLLLISQFYDSKGNPIENEDLELPYPDLSKFKVYEQ